MVWAKKEYAVPQNNEIAKAFDNGDNKKSGFVDFDGAKTALEQLNQEPCNFEVHLLLKMRGKDGKISKKDFSEYVSSGKPVGRFNDIQDLKNKQKYFEMNPDGHIKFEQIHYIMVAYDWYDYPRKLVREVFDENDPSKAGQYDNREFVEMMWGRLPEEVIKFSTVENPDIAQMKWE